MGGSTYIPAVRRKVTEHFGKKPTVKVNPGLAVVFGAARATSGIIVDPEPAGDPIPRIQLDLLPPVTPELECNIKGRTIAGARVEVTGVCHPLYILLLGYGFKAKYINRPTMLNPI